MTLLRFEFPFCQNHIKCARLKPTAAVDLWACARNLFLVLSTSLNPVAASFLSKQTPVVFIPPIKTCFNGASTQRPTITEHLMEVWKFIVANPVFKFDRILWIIVVLVAILVIQTFVGKGTWVQLVALSSSKQMMATALANLTQSNLWKQNNSRRTKTNRYTWDTTILIWT